MPTMAEEDEARRKRAMEILHRFMAIGVEGVGYHLPDHLAELRLPFDAADEILRRLKAPSSGQVEAWLAEESDVVAMLRGTDGHRVYYGVLARQMLSHAALRLHRKGVVVITDEDPVYVILPGQDADSRPLTGAPPLPDPSADPFR